MRVGIIGAMDEEVSLLRERIGNCKTTISVASKEIHTGVINNINVAVLKSGIGKVSAALSTVLLLECYRPKIVINTGSAGSLSPSLEVGDIAISNEVRYHDVDVTAFGYELGQMANCPVSFLSCSKLIAVAENSVKKLNLNSVSGLIISGDTFINGLEPLARIRANFPQAIAVEMEAAAVGHVCHQFSVPFIAIRAISDVADRKSHLSFSAFLNRAAKQSSLLIETLLFQLTNS